jgi:hypothetical protein
VSGPRDFKDPRYVRWRNAVYRRDKWACRMPGCPGLSKALNAHHIRRWANYPNLRATCTRATTAWTGTTTTSSSSSSGRARSPSSSATSPTRRSGTTSRTSSERLEEFRYPFVVCEFPFSLLKTTRSAAASRDRMWPFIQGQAPVPPDAAGGDFPPLQDQVPLLRHPGPWPRGRLRAVQASRRECRSLPDALPTGLPAHLTEEWLEQYQENRWLNLGDTSQIEVVNPFARGPSTTSRTRTSSSST